MVNKRKKKIKGSSINKSLEKNSKSASNISVNEGKIRVNSLNKDKKNKVRGINKNNNSNIESNIIKYKNSDNEKNEVIYKFSIFEVVVFMFGSVVFGLIVGYFVTYTTSGLSRIRSYPELKEIVNTYVAIKDNYYKDVDGNGLLDATISSMVEYLDDPNSVYLDGDSTDEFNDSLSDKYVGIGVSVSFENGYNKVIVVNEDGPADKAGIKVGDIILEVNNNDCYNVYGSSLSSLIKGKVGSEVVLRIKRDEEEMEVSVLRDSIRIDNISSRIIESDGKKFGYMGIKIFSVNISEEFEEKLLKLEKKKINYLIIDLRDNPGGRIDEAQKILELFFSKNTVLYKADNGKRVVSVKDSTSEKRDIPVAILVDGTSASSSEVVTACFKSNYKNGIVVGNRTYGKGTVQSTHSLINGTSFKYTTNKWLTPEGKWIDGKGIKPDYSINLDLSYFDNPCDDEDTQLQGAIEKLKESY